MHAGAVKRAWWMVDLQDDYVITHVKVTSRGGCPGDDCPGQCYCRDECREYMYIVNVSVEKFRNQLRTKVFFCFCTF